MGGAFKDSDCGRVFFGERFEEFYEAEFVFVVWVLLMGRGRDAIPSCKSGRSTFSVDAILVVEMKCLATQYDERDVWCRGRGDETSDSNG